MKKSVVLSFLLLLISAVAAHADYVILRDGKSYSGTFASAPNGKLSFQDSAGIQYTFPMSDVQSVVFSNVADHISLHGGQSYSGKLLGTTHITFRGANGIKYVFPVSDISSIIFTGEAAVAAQPAPQYGQVPPVPAGVQANAALPASAYSPQAGGAATPMSALVIPSGTQISVRTDVPIDTTKDAIGQTYPGRIQQDIVDSTGAVAIPAGTAAKLRVVDLAQNQNSQNYQNQGNATNARDLALGLYSVTLNGREYRVDTSSVMENGSAGYGMNRRTAIYAGGGAGLGALLGAVFGGGRGAGIGTLAGGGVGALAQYLTRGKNINVPAESVLSFQLQQTLVLHP